VSVSRVQVGLHTNCLKGVQISTPFVLKKRKNAIFIASATADSNVADGASRNQSHNLSSIQFNLIQYIYKILFFN
jgi:hypothetical protein